MAAFPKRLSSIRIKITPQGILDGLRFLLRLIRDLVAWSAFATLTAALLISMMTAQSPWNIVMGRPPASNRSPHAVWNNEQQAFGINDIVRVGDDQSVVATQLTEDTGTMLRIDAVGEVRRSVSVLLKEYSLFLWGDSKSSIWLHQGNKTLQRFDDEGGTLWDIQFDSWPEAAWCSSDGYTLAVTQDGSLNQSLTLITPNGFPVWEIPYALPSGTVIDAAIAPGGRAIALAVLKLDSATPLSYGYLLDQSKRVVKVANLGENVARKAVISEDGNIAAIGNAYKVAVLQNDPEVEVAEISLRSELQSLCLSGDGKTLVIASAIEPGIFLENNKSDIQVRSLTTGETLWSYQLREDLISLHVARNSGDILLTTPQWVKAFRQDGQASWSLEKADVGSDIGQMRLSPSGEVFAVLDYAKRVTIWKVPPEETE